MSGAGFLWETQSPAKMENFEARSGPSNVSTRFWTAFSLEVEHTASCFLEVMASSINRSTPGRRGTVPSRINPLKTSVFARWSSLTRACLSLLSPSKAVGHPTAFQWAVMRSLPPPTSNSFPYPSMVHSVSRDRSAKTRLKATRWASRSVSARTPSMSHRMASSDGAGLVLLVVLNPSDTDTSDAANNNATAIRVVRNALAAVVIVVMVVIAIAADLYWIVTVWRVWYES
mmetsp:Transcript_27543/g.60617  ORF Transcript_27543/g.60617 Transcript_27543/m.60617 type:complete len:230 (-) Transcript_27543:43-732(-)